LTALLIHLANLAFLASFLVRDILALRLLSVAGGGLLLATFLAASPISWPSVGWNVVFALINGAQIARLAHERRPVRLTRDERELTRLAFATLATPLSRSATSRSDRAALRSRPALYEGSSTLASSAEMMSRPVFAPRISWTTVRAISSGVMYSICPSAVIAANSPRVNTPFSPVSTRGTVSVPTFS
jgi:hypothetical protein